MSIKNQLSVIYELAIKDTKLRFANSTFGFLWMFLNPILLTLTLYVVFSIVMKMNLPNYQIFILLGIIVWNFFSEATSKSIDAIESNIQTLKKVKIKLYSIILGSNLSSTINFSINIIILIILMMFADINIFTPLRFLSIFYFALLLILVISTSLLISTLYINFRDTKHIWQFLLLVGFWITPIVYPETFVPKIYLKTFMLNPLARIISHLRNTLIYDYIDAIDQISITVILIACILFCSIWLFNKYSNKLFEEM